MEKIREIFSEDDYRALARRLDRDFNDKLTKNEFCDALLPNDVSREDVEMKRMNFLDKSPDFFYNPIKTTKNINENQMTQRRKYLNQNINLLNHDYDNVFFNVFSAEEEELKHIKPYFRNQEDVMAFANENFYKQRSDQPMKPQEIQDDKEIPLAQTKISKVQDEKNTDQSKLYKSDILMPSYKGKNNSSMMKANTQKRIFDNYNLSISPMKKSVEFLKQSMNDINVSQRDSAMIRGTIRGSIQKSKLAHLFEKTK